MFRSIAIGLALCFLPSPTVLAQTYFDSGYVNAHTWTLDVTEGGLEHVYILRSPHGIVLGAWYPDYQRYSAYSGGIWRQFVETAPVPPPAIAIHAPTKVRNGEYVRTPGLGLPASRSPNSAVEPIYEKVPNFGVDKSQISSESRTTVHYGGKVHTLSAEDVPQDGKFHQMIFIADTLEQAKQMKATFLASPEAAPFKDKMHFHAMAKDDKRLECGYDTAPGTIYCQDYSGKVRFRADATTTSSGALFGAVRRLPNPNYDPKKDPVIGSDNPLGPVWNFLMLNKGASIIIVGGLLFVYLRNRKPAIPVTPVFTLKV